MTTKRPLIGLTTYRKKVSDAPAIHVDGLMPTYTDAILAAGGLPVMIPLTYNNEQISELFEQLDGILLPGGGDIDPHRYGGNLNGKVYGIDDQRDRIELWLAREAILNDKPVLCICRGHQVLNVALGGSLWEDIVDLMPDAIIHAYFRGYERNLLSHQVDISATSCLAQTINFNGLKYVNSIHHQGIKDLADSFVPVAYAPDGLIEGIEIPGHRFAVGVQWHPEEFTHQDSHTLNLFQGLVGAAAR